MSFIRAAVVIAALAVLANMWDLNFAWLMAGAAFYELVAIHDRLDRTSGPREGEP